MKTSESIQTLAEALAKFQGAMRTLPKPKKGYGYNYTPLDVVVEAIREPLSKNGLSFIQMPSATDKLSVALTTRLMHSSGEWIEGTMVIPIVTGKMNDVQKYGSSLTYARRYALTSILGVVADEDADGSTEKPRASIRKTAKEAPPPAEKIKSDDKTKYWNSLTVPERSVYKAMGNVMPYILAIPRYEKNTHAANNAWKIFSDNIPAGATAEDGRARVVLVQRVAAYAALRDAGMSKDKAELGALSQVTG